MKMIRLFGAAAALLLAGSYTAANAGAHESGATLTGDGSCTYVQENMFAGPFNVCQEPIGAESCDEIGQTDDNADAAHSGDACPTEGLIGTCDLGDSQMHYFSGEADGLEIGCGFQGGDWVTAE